ncbi:cytochrome P450 monooxygenase [Leptodontidium sp. MPI-SDFR-AT-0119]|nr:cytochrome P450 monooxygenase [Leptodontidium sp. MPI-SDFR-AT-0119]
MSTESLQLLLADIRLDFMSFGLLLATAALSVSLLYQWALPKPIPGIRYNEKATKSILGDAPAMISYITKNDAAWFEWLLKTSQDLKSPIVQVFLRPLSSPLVVLCDFREAQDVLIRRREFDRSPIFGDLFSGLGPDHHINQPTNHIWQSHRRLLKDLMSPPFLRDVAGPSLHANLSKLVRLWEIKASIAGDRPFSAHDDIYEAALDAVQGFVFGEGFPHSATEPKIQTLLGLDKLARAALLPLDKEEPVGFPRGETDPVVKATLDLSASIEELQSSMAPRWRYKLWTSKKPWVRRALATKNIFVRHQLEIAVKRLYDSRDLGSEPRVQSAVDYIVLQNEKLAEKENKKPDFYSGAMMDESFGLITAGHDTTSTTVLWALKYLADHPSAQHRLRAAIRINHVHATAEKRNPAIEEIMGSQIPLLDATLEECLRCAPTAPGVDRQAQCDTELLGHFIPKGTIVMCLSTGPSMMAPSFEITEDKRSVTSQLAKREGRDRSWDPEDIGVFKPERWLKPTADGKGLEFDPTAGPLLAFGLGIRACFGRKLAYLELRVLTTLILWNFELLPCPKELSGYKIISKVSNSPKQCYVRLRKIDS